MSCQSDRERKTKASHENKKKKRRKRFRKDHEQEVEVCRRQKNFLRHLNCATQTAARQDNYVYWRGEGHRIDFTSCLSDWIMVTDVRVQSILPEQSDGNYSLREESRGPDFWWYRQIPNKLLGRIEDLVGAKLQPLRTFFYLKSLGLPPPSLCINRPCID